MKAVFSPAHRRHDPKHEVCQGEEIGMYERPERADRIEAALNNAGVADWVAPAEHGLAPIEAVHDPALVAYLATAYHDWHAGNGAREAIPDTYLNPAMREGMGPAPVPSSAAGRFGYWSFDTATPMVAGTYAAARAAVDVALTATELVLGGERTAYGLCRPPGHHAPRAAFGGYCFFNNVAVAAQHALARGAARVAVLDVDYHHGNGTQQLFYDRGDVLFVSLHADPHRAYPYFTGHADETGTGEGLGLTRNHPLPADCDNETYLRHLDDAVQMIDGFGPDLVFVSLGVDTYALDPIGDFAVTAEAYHPMGARVAALRRPTVVVQEGGYHLDTVGTNVTSFLAGLSDGSAGA